jgi:Fungal Rad9-like Rad53-binding/BRCA1 C Terminus (BRCT) domain
LPPPISAASKSKFEPIGLVSEQRVPTARQGEEDQSDDVSQTIAKLPRQVTQGFSHLASTVPDSQGLQQSINASASLTPLAPPANPPPSSRILLKRMASQSSPHDTQELSQSYYANLINAHRSKSALGLAEGVLSEDVGDAVTQRTINTGDLGHIDLGLDDSCEEDDNAQASDADLHSEPLDFSPTQETQNRLSQFPESQRFKTPATNGKKRNFVGQVLESPILPRNPLARNGVIETPTHALGLSQVFAGTQAGSSPFMTRHVSAPTSDQPSPNIEMQARPAAASVSSPLRPRSELKRIVAGPQSGYVPMQQSQEERDRLEALQRQSSDAIEADEQFDEDFDEEPSIVKRARRQREREEDVREQFARFTSPTCREQNGKTGEQSVRGARTRTSPPINHYNRRPGPLVRVEEGAVSSHGRVRVDSEDETDAEEEDRVVIRNSSQLPQERDGEDKEKIYAKALRVPETVVRLNQAIHGQEAQDVSPTLRRSMPVEPTHSSGTTEQAALNVIGATDSSTVAVANSQPDQPALKKIPADLGGEPCKGFLDGSRVSSLAAGATQVSSSPRHDEVTGHHDPHQLRGAEVKTAENQHREAINQGDGNELHGDELSVGGPRPKSADLSGPSLGEKQHAEPPSTVPETTSAHGSATIPAQDSLEPTLLVNAVPAKHQSGRFESAQTHLLSSTTTSRPLNALFSNPSGRQRRRLGDIAAQPSPTRTGGEKEVEELMAAMDDRDFYIAVGDVPGSSSPIPPGRNSKRRRLVDRQAVSSRATSISADAHLPSSPPTSALPAVSHMLDQVSSDASSRTQQRPPRRFEAIWDVQTSPPKSAPARSVRNVAKELRASSGKILRPHLAMPAQQHEPMVVETVQAEAYQETRQNISPQEPLDKRNNNQQTRPHLAELLAPNQVLACFNGNPRGYYPATCIGSTGLKSEGTFRYQIQWDDSSRDDIDEHGIRGLDLRIGDQVKVNIQGWPRVSHIIQGFKDRVGQVEGEVTDVRGFKTLLVKAKRRKSLPADVSTGNLKEAPMSAVYLDTNMWRQMKDRVFKFDATHEKAPFTLHIPQPAPSRSGVTTPSERPSTPVTPNSRTRRKTEFPAQPASASFPFSGLSAPSGILSNMVFAISYDDETRKTSLAKAILGAGGTLLGEDFLEMFAPQSTLMSPSGQASEAAAALTLNARFSTKGFASLIADRHSRKAKYMQALALGIPCLGGRWVEACITANRILDWGPYLLSAGESLELEGAVRSRVLPAVDANTALLKDMIAARPNLLQGEAVIVLKGRGKAEEKRRPYIFLTKAAGAGKLEACVDLKSAKALLDREAESAFEWVFVDDKELGKAEATLLPRGSGKSRQSKELRVVGNEFLCQSLILGRKWEQY